MGKTVYTPCETIANGCCCVSAATGVLPITFKATITLDSSFRPFDNSGFSVEAQSGIPTRCYATGEWDDEYPPNSRWYWPTNFRSAAMHENGHVIEIPCFAVNGTVGNAPPIVSSTSDSAATWVCVGADYPEGWEEVRYYDRFLGSTYDPDNLLGYSGGAFGIRAYPPNYWDPPYDENSVSMAYTNYRFNQYSIQKSLSSVFIGYLVSEPGTISFDISVDYSGYAEPHWERQGRVWVWVEGDPEWYSTVEVVLSGSDGEHSYVFGNDTSVDPDIDTSGSGSTILKQGEMGFVSLIVKAKEE